MVAACLIVLGIWGHSTNVNSEALQSSEPAEVVMQMRRGPALAPAQPVLQPAVVAVDVVDVSRPDRAQAGAEVDSVVLHFKMTCGGGQRRGAAGHNAASGPSRVAA